jgi:3-hydroxyacyl-[acyl-carrier-protein] dehydratase
MRWLLIDKVLEMNPGKNAVGVRCFSRSELFFMDHFPAYPIVPGVLQIEMIAQLAGKCIVASNPSFMPVLTSVHQAKFRKEIFPGDKSLVYVDVEMRKSYSTAKGRIEVEGILVSTAEVMYGHITFSEQERKKDAYARTFSSEVTTIYGI